MPIRTYQTAAKSVSLVMWKHVPVMLNDNDDDDDDNKNNNNNENSSAFKLPLKPQARRPT